MTARLVAFAACAGLFGCASPPEPWPCRALLTHDPGPRDVAQLQAILDEVRTKLLPEDADLSIRLVPRESETDFFASNLAGTTISDEPRLRAYWVQYNPAMFTDPPDRGAVLAILVHELGHVRDYTGMDTDTLVEFALAYGLSDDNSAIERRTDLFAMQLGCAEGLVTYREWLYARLVDHPDALARKKHEYFTPEELRAWIVDHM